MTIAENGYRKNTNVELSGLKSDLVIYYKFIGYFDIGGIIKANYTADLREGVAVEYVTCEPTTNQYDIYQGRIVEKHRAAQ